MDRKAEREFTGKGIWMQESCEEIVLRPERLPSSRYQFDSAIKDEYGMNDSFYPLSSAARIVVVKGDVDKVHSLLPRSTLIVEGNIGTILMPYAGTVVYAGTPKERFDGSIPFFSLGVDTKELFLPIKVDVNNSFWNMDLEEKMDWIAKNYACKKAAQEKAFTAYCNELSSISIRYSGETQHPFPQLRSPGEGL